MSSDDSTSAAFDTKQFRNALGAFPTGVTVITTCDAQGNHYGVTASSFNSVSLEPPLVLWSIGKSSTSYEAFMDAENWNVHVLATDQVGVSGNFARSGGDKFGDVTCTNGLAGVPVIDGCAAVFQCLTEHRYEGGDHIIMVGRVIEYSQEDKQPLVFHNGAYSALV